MINENFISNGLDSELFAKHKQAQAEWEEICKREEEYWRHKSHEPWLREGDRNTNFF